MNNRKRWASKEDAKLYANEALQKGRVGLSFSACCDYLGWVPVKAIARYKETQKEKAQKQKALKKGANSNTQRVKDGSLAYQFLPRYDYSSQMIVI